MTRGDYGMWHITIPAKDGQPAIPHNSKIKVSRNDLRKRGFVAIDKMIDLNGDSNVGRTARANPSLDDKGYPGSDILHSLRWQLLESTVSREVHIQECSTSEASKCSHL